MYIWKLVDSNGNIVKYNDKWLSGSTDADSGQDSVTIPPNDTEKVVNYRLVMYDSDDPSCSGKSTVTVPACESSECNCDSIHNCWEEEGPIVFDYEAEYIKACRINPDGCKNITATTSDDWVHFRWCSEYPSGQEWYRHCLGDRVGANPGGYLDMAVWPTPNYDGTTERTGYINFIVGNGTSPCSTKKLTIKQTPPPLETCNCDVAGINEFSINTIPGKGVDSETSWGSFNANTELCNGSNFSVRHYEGMNFVKVDEVSIHYNNGKYYLYGGIPGSLAGNTRQETLQIYIDDEPCNNGTFSVTQNACNCRGFNINGLTLADGEIHSERVPIATSYIGDECKELAMECMESDGPGTFIDLSSIMIDSDGNITAPISEENNTGADIQQTIKIVPPGETTHCHAFTVTQPSTDCSCSVTNNYPGGVTDTGYIPQVGKTSLTLATIASECSNLSLSGTCDWINEVHLAVSPDYKMLIGLNASENHCSTNRKATFNIMKSETEICGTVNVFQKGVGITDVKSFYTGDGEGGTGEYAPATGGRMPIGTFKSTCNVTNEDVTIIPNCPTWRGWVTIVGIEPRVGSESNVYNVIIEMTNNDSEEDERQCSFGIRNSDILGGSHFAGTITVIQSRRR